jgi:DnaJ-domain-containing protein 1
VSIGRRLIDMARSELNSLLDVAAKHVRDEDGDDEAQGATGPASGGHVRGSSAWQDEAEWQRRAHQEVEDAIHGRRTAPDPAPPRPGSRPRGTGPASGSSARPSAGRPKSGLVGEALRVQKAYAMLEVPSGSNFETVRRSYRALMRKYHPDHHTQSPEKQRAANDVAQKLTEAYKLLEKRLRT